jgi:hypothetical protein
MSVTAFRTLLALSHASLRPASRAWTLAVGECGTGTCVRVLRRIINSFPGSAQPTPVPSLGAPPDSLETRSGLPGAVSGRGPCRRRLPSGWRPGRGRLPWGSTRAYGPRAIFPRVRFASGRGPFFRLRARSRRAGRVRLALRIWAQGHASAGPLRAALPQVVSRAWALTVGGQCRQACARALPRRPRNGPRAGHTVGRVLPLRCLRAGRSLLVAGRRPTCVIGVMSVGLLYGQLPGRGCWPWGSARDKAPNQSYKHVGAAAPHEHV